MLEVSYEGTVQDPPKQATALRAVHRKGQTFLTWTEIDRLIGEEKVRWPQFLEKFQKAFPVVRNTWHKHPPLTEKRTVLYRIYRAERPITAANLAQAELIDEIWPLSGYDGRIHQHRVAGEVWRGLDPQVIVPRYTIVDVPSDKLKRDEDYVDGRHRSPQWTAPQIPLHTGLYVHQASKPGRCYYAVTTLVNGVENTRDLSAANALVEPIEETVGAGEPILYRRLDNSYRRGRAYTYRETQFYVYWAAPPYANLPRVPIHLLAGVVGEDPKAKRTLRLHIGTDGMYYGELLHGTWIRKWGTTPHIAFTIFYDVQTSWQGYSDHMFTLRAPSQGTPQPYTKRLVDLLLNWARQRWNFTVVDRPK
jgi:hypothetical protein